MTVVSLCVYVCVFVQIIYSMSPCVFLRVEKCDAVYVCRNDLFFHMCSRVWLLCIVSNIFRAGEHRDMFFNGMCSFFCPCKSWAIFYSCYCCCCCCWLKRSQNQNISTLKTRSNFNEVIIVDFLVLCNFLLLHSILTSHHHHLLDI